MIGKNQRKCRIYDLFEMKRNLKKHGHLLSTVPDGVFSAEKDPWRIFDHVVVGGRVAGDDGGGQDVVVVSRGTFKSKLGIIAKLFYDEIVF